MEFLRQETIDVIESILLNETSRDVAFVTCLEETKSIIQEKDDMYKQQLKELLNLKEQKSNDLKISADAESFKNEFTKVKRLIEEQTGKADELDKKFTDSNRILQEKLKKLDEIESECQGIDQPDVERIKCDNDLYSKISKITWDLKEGDEIKGVISVKNGGRKNLRPFSLNTKHNSSFFITNYLWDMMETDF